MGTSNSVSYMKYDSDGNLTKRHISGYHVGWVKILDIFFEDENEIKIKVTADVGIPFLYNNPGVPLVLKKNNVNYEYIVPKIIKGESIYVETGEYNKFPTKKVMITSIVDPDQITATITFGSYSREKYYKSYYRLLPPDVFSIAKSLSHKVCEQYCFLVPTSFLSNLVEGCEYEITAVNKFNSKTFVVTSGSGIQHLLN